MFCMFFRKARLACISLWFSPSFLSSWDFSCFTGDVFWQCMDEFSLVVNLGEMCHIFLQTVRTNCETNSWLLGGCGPRLESQSLAAQLGWGG
jgi:hypothetical protein